MENSTPTATTLSMLFRFVECFLAMVFFSWVCIRLPFAFKTSGQFLRQFAGVIASPLFVFLLGNAIIVILFVKSERFSGEIPAADNAETLLYQEPEDCSAPANATSDEIGIAIEFQDKEVISPVDSVGEASNIVVMDIESESSSSSESESDDSKVYRRWKSEKVEREVKETMTLWRSETEKFSNGSVLFAGDELSDDEFQRAVDDFIAEQLRFRRQESLQPRLAFQNRKIK